MSCDWPVIVDDTCYPGWAGEDDATKAEAISWASEIMNALTGGQFGACPVVVMPCLARCQMPRYRTYPVDLDAGSTGGWVPVLWDGVWFNCVCGLGDCRCRARTEIALPGPVAAITAVMVDGVAVTPSAYRVDDGNLLVRQDGADWPRCQDFDAEPTFTVAYELGREVPIGGKVAAGILAAEYLKLRCGDDGCQLPQGVTQVTRQGVELTIEGTADAFKEGLIGITAVDVWIASVNPGHLRRPASVFSLDLDDPARQTTWSAP